jgi:hypothetical protein
MAHHQLADARPEREGAASIHRQPDSPIASRTALALRHTEGLAMVGSLVVCRNHNVVYHPLGTGDISHGPSPGGNDARHAMGRARRLDRTYGPVQNRVSSLCCIAKRGTVTKGAMTSWQTNGDPYPG